MVGSTGFPGVVSHAWDQLPGDLNVADWDVVLLDLTVFEDNPLLSASMQIDHLPPTDDFARLIFSPSEIVAIGSLSTRLGDGSQVLSRPYGGMRQFAADWWFPVPFAKIHRPGTVIHLRAEGLSWYFANVGGYREYFDNLPSGSVPARLPPQRRPQRHRTSWIDSEPGGSHARRETDRAQLSHACC